MTADTRAIRPRPLTKAAFARFGDVVETDGAEIRLINEGTTERFHDLASVDVASEGGRPLINLFRGQPFTLPVTLKMMERHPLGSQAFLPLSRRPFLVVVAPDADGVPGEPVAFLTAPGQGVNYARNVWHHPLVALGETADFVVVDRGGPGDNLQEHVFDAPWTVLPAE